jgi:hypothetical protein
MNAVRASKGMVGFLLPTILLSQTTWSLPPQFRAAGYTREFHDNALVLTGPGPSAVLSQTFDATPYRGQPVRLRATVRVEGAGAAQLLLRVDRPAELGFFDNMADRPIRFPDWTPFAVEGEVAPDAATIEVGVLSTGPTTVSVKDIVFERLPAAPLDPAAEAIRANYARVDAAYAHGDTAEIAALAVPEAEVILPKTHLDLAKLLASQKGVKLQSRSTVTHLRIDGAEATAWTNNETISGPLGVLTSNRDTWVRTPAGWRLQKSVLIATRPVTPPNVLAAIREYAGTPSWTNTRILLWQAAEPSHVEGFTTIPLSDLDMHFADQAAARAAAYLDQHAPEEAGPARLAFQSDDPARVAAVVRIFEQHRAPTAKWTNARHAALMVYQSKTLQGRSAQAIADNIIWFASEALPNARILAPVLDPATVAPLVVKRYRDQVYVVGTVPRELLGGDYFLDFSRVLPASPLGRWIAAQKFPFDGLAPASP